MNTNKEEVARRIRERMSALKIKGVDITREIGASSGAISQWRSFDIPATPQGEYLIGLARMFNCDPSWILNGEGKKEIVSSGLPKGVYEYIDYYVDVKGSCGEGVNDEQEFYEVERLAFRADWLKRENLNPDFLKVMSVKGDSMLPRLHEGDAVLIDTSETDITNGKVYAFRYGDDIKIKRLEVRYDKALIINSDNSSEYPQEIVPPKDQEYITIIGRVRRIVSGGGF